MKSLTLDCSSFSDVVQSDISYAAPVTTVEPAPPPPPPPASVDCYVSGQAANSYAVFSFQLTQPLNADLFLQVSYTLNGGLSGVFDFTVSAGKTYGSASVFVKFFMGTGNVVINNVTGNTRAFLPTVVTLDYGL